MASYFTSRAYTKEEGSLKCECNTAYSPVVSQDAAILARINGS